VALGMPGTVAVLDDALARRQARLLGIPVTGTLGILLKAKQVGHLAEIRPLLDVLESLHFFLDRATRRAVLEIAGE
jgi:predicted nucleic acid-binding protein